MFRDRRRAAKIDTRAAPDYASRMIQSEALARIRSGARVRVHERVIEGNKTRVSAFEGIVIARKHGSETGASFTVRGKFGEYGVEKTYAVQSPLIEKVDVLVSPKKVSRSKLYYIRGISARRLQKKLRA